MTLVYHDMREVILGIEGSEETGVAIFGVDAERLVCRNVNAGVLGVVRAVGSTKHLGGIGPEDILKCSERLGPKLIPVANEKCAFELPGVGGALQEINGDERLAGAGGQGEQSALRLFGKSAPRELLEDGADSGILVVAPRSFAARVGLKERLCLRRGQGEAHLLLIAGAKFCRGGKLGQEAWGGGYARQIVELDKHVPVGGEYKRHVQSLARGISLGLVKSMAWRQGVLLGFD